MALLSHETAWERISSEWLCDLWVALAPARLLVSQLFMNDSVHIAHWDVEFLSSVTKSNATIVLNQIFSQHTLSSVMDVLGWLHCRSSCNLSCYYWTQCTKPTPVSMTTFTLHLNKLTMNFFWWGALQMQKPDHTTHFHIWPYFLTCSHLTTHNYESLTSTHKPSNGCVIKL